MAVERDWVPIPAPRTVGEVTFRPVAVALYGQLRETVSIEEIDDGGLDPLCSEHTVLWALVPAHLAGQGGDDNER